MNNPESNFMSPLRSQPVKKQRGGSTPRSMMMSASSGASARSGNANANANASGNGSRPPPPTTATTTTTSTTEAVNEGLARRRAELRRLQDQRASRSSVSASAARRPPPVGTNELLSSHKSHTSSSNGSGSGNTSGSTSGNTSGPPRTTMPTSRPPAGGGRQLRHSSDLFPTVPKSPSRGVKKAPVPALAKPASGSGGMMNALPFLGSSESKSAGAGAGTGTGTGTTTTTSSSGQAPAVPVPVTASAPIATATATTTTTTKRPPPPLARKLDFVPGRGSAVATATTTASNRNNRAKSVPPRRPPAPPMAMAPASGAGKETPGRLQSSASATSATPTTTTTTNTTTNSSLKRSPPAPQPPMPPLAPTPIHTFVKNDNVDDDNNNNNKPSPSSIPPSSMSMARTPLKAEDVNDAKTPMPLTTPILPPPSTARRDKINSLRQGLGEGTTATATTTTTVDTSPNKTHSKNLPPATPGIALRSKAAERLEQALQEATSERLSALKQVIELEGQLLQARQEAAHQAVVAAAFTAAAAAASSPKKGTFTLTNPIALQTMLQVADQDGEHAALQWARAQIDGVPPLSSLQMPDSPAPRLLDTTQQQQRGRRRRGTTATTPTPPQPILPAGAQGQQPTKVQLERGLISHYREAASCLPCEYATALATFVVRRPYGMDTAPDLMAAIEAPPLANYSKQAHVSTPSSLLVVAINNLDGTYLVLESDPNATATASTTTIRYQSITDGMMWKTTVMDTTTMTTQDASMLGSVTYIDNEGVERDYSLDALVEDALTVRDQYCQSIMMTALGFKERPAVVVTNKTTTVGDGGTAEMATDTADIPYPPPTIDVHHQEPGKDKAPVAAAAAAAAAVKPPPPSSSKKETEDPEADTGSGDVLATFIGMMVSSLVGFVYWVLIGLPLTILKTSVVTVFVAAFMTTFYLYVLDQQYEGHALSIVSSATSSISSSSSSSSSPPSFLM